MTRQSTEVQLRSRAFLRAWTPAIVAGVIALVLVVTTAIGGNFPLAGSLILVTGVALDVIIITTIRKRRAVTVSTRSQPGR